MIATQNLYNRVIRKVGKTQHQNPEFGHTQGENFERTLSLVIHRVRFLKKPAKKYISIQGGMKLKKDHQFW
jgi:hypothetical protein